MIKVSIIIPIYNVSQYLRDCLDSVINQSYKNLEIICVNDGSTDECENILIEYANQDSRIVLLNKKNEGLPLARKSGLSVATGDYVFHLDGDDSIPKDTIMSMVKIAHDSGADIVVGDYVVVHDDINTYQDSSIEKMLTSDEYLRYILTVGLFNIWGKLIKRTLYENDIEFPKHISIAEDLIGVYQIAYYAKKIMPCHEACYYYYIRSTSMSLNNNIGELTDRSIYAVLFLMHFNQKHNIESNHEEFQQFLIKFIHAYLLSPYEIKLRKQELEKIIDKISMADILKVRNIKLMVIMLFAKINIEITKKMVNKIIKR